MPELNKVEIIIDNEKYSVFTDENIDYIKKIENLINTQVEYFKNSDKRFNSHTSLIFTAFIIADKYLKTIRKLDEMEIKFKTEPEKIKEEKQKVIIQLEQLKKEYENVCHEKEKYLEELLIKNNENKLFEDTINKYRQMLDSKSKELMKLEMTVEELKKKNNELEKILDIETSS